MKHAPIHNISSPSKGRTLWPALATLLTVAFIACAFGFSKAAKHPQEVHTAHSQEAAQPTAPVFQHLTKCDIERNYAFIHYDSNQLWIGSDSSLMNHAFAKWIKVASTGQDNFNIMHIGSSHVQGGTFPHRIRQNILRNHFDRIADRGMLFPYSAASNCNNPHDYAVHCPQRMSLCRNVYKEPTKQLGLCGIAVTAADTTTTIDIALKDEGIDYATNQIIVLGYRSDSLHEASSSSKAAHPGDELVPLINYQGSNVAPSYIDLPSRRYIFNLNHNVDNFRIILPCCKGQMFTLTGVYLGNRGRGFSYHSIGVNGASLDDYNTKCPYFRCDLRLVKPDLVIMGIGINDAAGPNFDSATFHRRYLTLIDSIRYVNRNCAFIFITNNDSYKRVSRRRSTANKNVLQVQQVMYALAQETKGAVWDQFKIMGGLQSMTRWRDNKLAQRDRVHFTAQGYALMGDLLSNALFDAVNYYNDQRLAQQEASAHGRRQSAAVTVKQKNIVTAQDNNDSNKYYLSY